MDNPELGCIGHASAAVATFEKRPLPHAIPEILEVVHVARKTRSPFHWMIELCSSLVLFVPASSDSSGHTSKASPSRKR